MLKAKDIYNKKNMRGIKSKMAFVATLSAIFLQGCSQPATNTVVKNDNANQPKLSSDSNANANADSTSAANNQTNPNINSAPINRKKNASEMPEPKPSFGSGAADLSILMSVRNKLSSDDNLINNVIIDVKEGNVTLTGNVSNEEQKKKAEDLARETQSVKSVKNNLRVGSSK